jgi:hypothetical protein
MREARGRAPQFQKTMPRTKYLLKLIAILEIVGSLFGFYILYSVFGSATYDESTFLLYVLLFSALFAVTVLALTAGILLWRERRIGFALSVLVQAVQIPILTSAIFQIQLMFGVGIWAYARVDGQFKIGMHMDVGAQEYLGWRPGSPFSFGVNLVAIYFFYVLLRAMAQRARAQRAERTVGDE